MSCSVRLPKLFFFTDTATTEIYTLSLHDALPILGFSVALSPTTLMYCMIGVTVGMFIGVLPGIGPIATVGMLLDRKSTRLNSSHSQISYAVFCLKKKNLTNHLAGDSDKVLIYRAA